MSTINFFFYYYQPKYIANLLRSAELRQVEHERRTERKVQKERETEGDMFNDKESYVTPAYREKLAELKKLEEEERLRELRESRLRNIFERSNVFIQ